MQIDTKDRSIAVMPSIVLIAVIIFVSVFTLLRFDYVEKRNDAVTAGHNRMLLTLDNKIEEVQNWRNTLTQNARLIAEIPFFAEQVHSYLLGATTAAETLRWMHSLQDNLHYDFVRLIDSSGKILLSVTDSPEKLDSYGSSLVTQVIRTKEVTLSDIHLTQTTGKPIISLFVPIFTPQQPNQQLGAMLFCLSPIDSLQRIVGNRQAEPAAISSYLVRLENKTEVIPLADGSQGSAVELFSSQDILTAVDKTEHGLVFETSASGKKQLLIARPVSDTNWIMLSAMDVEELYSPIRERYWVIVSAVFLILAFGGGGLAFVWNKRQAQWLNQQLAYVEQCKKAESSLRRMQLFAEQTRDSILFADQSGQIIEANHAACTVYGYSREELRSLRISDLAYDGPLPQDVPYNDTDNLFETAQSRKDGSFFFAELSWQRLTIDHEVISVFVIRDLTQRKATEQQLTYISTHDALTGLSNRSLLREYLEQAVQRAKAGKFSSMLVLDIDNFKMINDSLGHAAGDALLRELVAHVRGQLRESDQIARLGGDEFAIILSDMSHEAVKAFADSLRRTTEQMEICFENSCTSVSISISIGVVLIDGSLESQKVLSQADFAVQLAKDKGRNRVVFAKRETRGIERLSEASEVLHALRTALKTRGFSLCFQPVVRIKDWHITHYEALIRLKDASGNPISPATFIPIAETFGLMPNIDRWVIQQAIDKLKQHRSLTLFVNISGVSFGDDELLSFIKIAIRNAGVEPQRIGFEITETAAVADLATAVAWVSELSALGCPFALDDFGIGFSSFSYVSNFPVTYIKVDGSYVRDMDVNEKHRTIVEAIVRVAQSLGKQVIAEHVESEAILEMLRHMRVSCAQGYHTGRPSPWLLGENDISLEGEVVNKKLPSPS